MRTILGGLGRRIPRPTPAMGVALLALLIACSGAAFANIPSEDGTITACRDNRTGVLRAIDAETNQTCRASETQLPWKNGIKGEVADALHADQADNADTIDGLDSSALQRRVSASCDPESAIRAIGDDGTVTCEQDDGNAGQVNADDMAPLPAVSVSANQFQPIASRTHTPFEFNFEDFDQVGAGQTGEMHSATQPTRLVAPRTGLYQINIHAFWQANGTGVREIWFLHDRAGSCTSGSFARDITNGVSDVDVQHNTSALFFLNQGSYIEVCGLQNSGVSLGALATVSMHYVSGV